MANETPTITARGPVKKMGATQFNVLEYDTDRYMAEFERAGCDTKPGWSGSKPLLVTISRREWVSQLNPGDIVEYVLEPVRRKSEDSPTGFKVETKGIAMRIISRATQ